MSTALRIRARRSPSATATVENIQPADLLGSLQWMPPGKSTISASVNGVAKNVTVIANQETAQMVDGRIKEMISKAHGGSAGLPYIDFDHSDGEAAAWPQGASWGGDDPLTGGVRLQLEWSDVGRAKVKGKSYQGFSPEFMLKDGVVTDVGLNLGGLVNRPAFTGIQRVTAAQCDETFEAENKTENPACDLLAKAVRVQAERGVKAITEAVRIAAAEDPELYEKYREMLTGSPSTAVKAATFCPDASEFIVQAKKLQSDRALSAVDAMLVLAHERDDLYLQFMDSLGLNEPAPVRAKKTNFSVREKLTVQAKAVTEATDLIIQAKRMASETRLDPFSAILILARQKPELYTQYVESLGLGAPVDIGVQEKRPDPADDLQFVVKSKALAETEKIEGVAASLLLAKAEPLLYEAYRSELGARR